MVEFFNIKNKLEDLETTMDLIYKQWGQFLKKSKYERINSIIFAIKNNLNFPEVYIMKLKNEVIGTFTIKEMEIENEGKFPSVWYLLIKEEYRKKGYGKLLLEYLNNICEKFSQIYLLTEHTGLYEKIGFKFIKETNHNGQLDRLYVKTNN